MNYEAFSKLWDALVTNRPKPAVAASDAAITNGMTEATASALIEYGNGNKSKINAVREFLSKPASV